MSIISQHFSVIYCKMHKKGEAFRLLLSVQ